MSKLTDSDPIGVLIKRARTRQGRTQQRLAEILCDLSHHTTLTRDDIQRWEHGKRVPGQFWLRWLSEALLVPLETLEKAAYVARQQRSPDVESQPINASNALRIAHEWLLSEPPQVVERRAGRRVGQDLADRLMVRVHELRLLDDFVYGSDLWPAVIQEFNDVVDLVKDASFSDKTGRTLYTAIGELAQLAGWVASDAGMFREAERVYLQGAEAAQAGGNAPLVGNLLSSLSYQMANIGNAPNDAILLARSAVKGASEQATPTTRALLLERVAWAQAKAGRANESIRTLATVNDAYGSCRSEDDDPVWVYWLNRAEIDIMAGRCYTELAMPLRAVPLLAKAIESYDTQYAREVILYQSWLAEAFVQAHEVEQAVSVTHSAIDLSEGVHSKRALDRLSVVRHRLEPFKDTRAVRELDEHANAVAASEASKIAPDMP